MHESRSRFLGGILPAAIVLLAAMLAALLGAATSAAKPSDVELSQSLTEELAEQGIDVDNVSSCKPRNSGKVFVCKWRGEGFFPGEVPYLCAGRSKYNVQKQRWNLGGCHNRLEPQVPLLPEAGPHPAFGFNEDWLSASGQLDQAAAIGANVVRQGLFWDVVENNRGSFDWSLFDGFYQQVLSQGMRPLWVLYAAPCWAQAKGCKQARHPSEEHYDELAAFAAQAAVRYPEAIGIEVWNEPNYDLFWGGHADPQSYGRMLAAVAPAIHAANSEMPVISAGLSPHINTVKDAMAYKKFLRRAYQTGGPQLADAIGAHPYPNRLYTQDYLGNVRTHLFRHRSVMGQNGDATKPIWVTEVGSSTAGKEAFTAEHQAEGLARMYTQFRRIENVPVVIFHRFVDQPGSPRVVERGYGVLSGSGDPKPAYCAVAEARERPC